MMPKPFCATASARDTAPATPFGQNLRLSSSVAPANAQAEPRSKKQKQISEELLPPHAPILSDSGPIVGGSLVDCPLLGDIKKMALCPERLKTLPVDAVGLIAHVERQCFLAGLAANECRRRVDSELELLAGRASRSDEETNRWRKKFADLEREHEKQAVELARSTNREAAVRDEVARLKKSEATFLGKIEELVERVKFELARSTNCETALRGEVARLKKSEATALGKIEELERVQAELRAGIGLDQTIVFECEDWSGLRYSMEQHYINEVIEEVTKYCGGDISKYRSFLKKQEDDKTRGRNKKKMKQEVS